MTKKDLKERYNNEIKPELMKAFKLKNIMEAPHLTKIVLNRGLGEVNVNKNVVDLTVQQFIAITGQKPVLNKAKKAISNFKLRKDQVIGCSVTLRGNKMYDFLEKFINIVLPKIKDFRGVPKNSFDGQGNYSMGITEDSIFPEINSELDKLRGLNITLVTSSKATDEQAYELLRLMGMPFRKN